MTIAVGGTLNTKHTSQQSLFNIIKMILIMIIIKLYGRPYISCSHVRPEIIQADFKFSFNISITLSKNYFNQAC